MKRVLELALVAAGVAVLVLSFQHPSIWGFILGGGLIFAPLVAGRMLLVYVAMVGIPLGLGILLGFLAKQQFGSGFLVGVGFVAGIVIGGKFVLSDAFDRIASIKEHANNKPSAGE